MKKLHGLNEPIIDLLTGEAVIIDEKKTPFTFKMVFARLLLEQNISALDSLKATELAKRILGAKDGTVELDEHAYGFIEKAVNTNASGFRAGLLGQVAEKLNGAK